MEDSLEDYLDEETARLLHRYEKECEEGRYGFYDVDEYVSLIGILMLYSDLHKALQLLLLARKQYPAAVELELKHAELCLEMGFFDQALSLLDNVEKIEPYLFDIYLVRGHIWKLQSKYDEARACFLKARQNGADEVDVRMGLAETELAEGHNDKAWAHMQHILGAEDDTAELCNRFIDMAKNAQVLPEAIAFTRGLLQKRPYSVLYWKLLAELAESAECYEQALEADDFILAISPDDRETLMHKFRMLENAGSDLNNLDFYLKLELLAADSDILPDIWERIALEYEKLEDIDRAAVYYRRELDYPEFRQYALFRLGVISNFRLDFTTALVFFSQALECEEAGETSCRAMIYRGMARTCYYLGQPDEVMQYNRLAIETEADNPLHLYAYVLDACDIGEIKAASDYIDRQAEANPTPALWLAKACLLYYQNRAEEAYGFFARAFAADELTRKDADEQFQAILEADPHILEMRNAYAPPMGESEPDFDALYLYYGPDEQYLREKGLLTEEDSSDPEPEDGNKPEKR